MRPTRFVRLCAVVVFLATGAPLLAQDEDQLKRDVLRPTIEALQAVRGMDELKDLTDQVLNDHGKFVLAAAASTENGRFIAEANRLDKQVGTSSRGVGTTNLVTSGSVPRLLGLAVETGAITQTQSGTSVTFQTNPAGLAEALTKGVGAVDSSQTDAATQHTLTVLRRFNVSATFDTNQDSQQGFTGNFRQLQQFSTQVYLHNHRDPTHPAWRGVWSEFGQLAGNKLPNVIVALALDLQNNAGYRALVAQTRERILTATTDADIERAIFEHADQIRGFIPATLSSRMLDEWARYLRTQNRTYAEIARSQVLTFEYALDRPPAHDAPVDASTATAAVDEPRLSTFRIVWVRPFLGASDMTVNTSFSVFNEPSPRVRDWQVGGKLDFPLRGVSGFSKSQFTLAAMYLHLRESPLGVPVTVNGVPVDRTGDMGFFQARLKVPLGDSGFSVPFSVTYASRTELITNESTIRGNVGLTLDLDKLTGAK